MRHDMYRCIFIREILCTAWKIVLDVFEWETFFKSKALPFLFELARSKSSLERERDTFLRDVPNYMRLDGASFCILLLGVFS